MRILLPRPGARSFVAIVFAVLAVAIAGVGYLVFDYLYSGIGNYRVPGICFSPGNA